MAIDEQESSSSSSEDKSRENYNSSSSGFYDDYDAKEILGKGLSSTVRRCVKRSTGEHYAVKILDVTTEKMTVEQAIDLKASTMSEISTLRQLSGHPNIIQLHDFYTTPTFFFIVFELARGGELFDYLTEVVIVSEKKTRNIMRQLLEAVAFMHAKNIIHRDLKIYMLRAIQEGKYEFRSPEWDEIGSSPKDLIRKLLVVDPKQRFTAAQALAHPYLMYTPIREMEPLTFNARWRFRMAIWQVRALVRLLRIKKIPQIITIVAVKTNPYAARKIRKQIDAVAFQMYGHWVKKGREQYRDALFANALDEKNKTKSSHF